MPDLKTPRTDARTFTILSDLQSGTREVVAAEFAKELETELAAAQASIAEVTRERDTWMVEAKRLGQIVRALGVESGVPPDRSAQEMGDALLDKIESAEALVASLSEALREANLTLVAAFHRIHCSPRTTDTALAHRIELTRAKIMDALPEEPKEAI